MNTGIDWITVSVSIVLCIIAAQVIIAINLNKFINLICEQEKEFLKEVKKITLNTIKKPN